VPQGSTLVEVIVVQAVAHTRVSGSVESRKHVCALCMFVQVSGEDVYQHVLYPHYLAVARGLFDAVVDHGLPASQAAASSDPRVQKVFDASAKCSSASWWSVLGDGVGTVLGTGSPPACSLSTCTCACIVTCVL
jgi:hypothetical protein